MLFCLIGGGVIFKVSGIYQTDYKGRIEKKIPFF